MADYLPTSRRPIADAFRKTAHGVVKLCVRWGVHPDVISYLSIVASTGAALSFWQAGKHPALLLIAPALCYVRLWFNMLDGMVALASGKASLRGEILNELPDRASDLLIFAGVAHSGLCSPFTAYWAAIGALLTAYVGTLGQAVSGRREFAGIMSKPLRMIVLHIGAWTTAGFHYWGGGQPRYANWTILDWTCLIVVVGCLQTIAVRLARTFQALREKGAKA